MGTRGLTAVMLDKEYKVAQYGQWDHYPSGQGVEILKFLQECDFNRLKEKVRKCYFMMDKEFDALIESCDIDGPDGFETMKRWEKQFPHLSRDMGGKIIEHIYKAEEIVPLQNTIEFVEDSLFCEYAYVVDLDKMVFEVHKGYNKTPNKPTDRFYDEKINKSKREYYGVTLLESFELARLPTKAAFLLKFADRDD